MISRRLRYWWHSRERERLLREEMEIHIQALAQDLIEDGMKEQDAHYEARRRFGNMALKSEESRSAWVSQWMSDAAQDLRYTLRTLRREKGFALFAILIVGLGIGASSTVFSVFNALLIRPLPFESPNQLAWIANGGDDGDLSGQTIQVDHMLDLRRQNRSFQDIAAYFAFYSPGDAKLTGVGEPERLTSVPVSQNFFALLGVKPQIGRLFNDAECKWNGPGAVLLSNGLWKRRFASDPSVIGRSLTLNEKPVTIVGVLPESFDFATVFAPGSHVDLYNPFPLSPETNRWGNTLALIGRLKPESSVQSAQSELQALSAQIRQANPRRNGLDPKLTSLESHVSGRIRPALLVLACSVGVVMLIVCANLSNLQLARTVARHKEMAVRTALGAGRQRLIRQMLTESLVLSLSGAILGLLLAVGGTRILSRLDAISIPMLSTTRIDATAFAFTAIMAIVTGLVFGVLPAFHIPALAVHDSLKESSRSASGGKRHAWIRSTLVISEIAFACMLLVGAGLLIRSFLRVLDVDLGFRPERAVALRVDPSTRFPNQAKRNAYFDELLRVTRSIPGIESAGLSDVLPLGINRSWGVAAKGQVYTRENYPDAFVRIVSDGYLTSMGIPLRRGRDLTERDNQDSAKVILINETLARRLWPGENPIGRVVQVDGEREVVGVVADVRHVALEKGSGSEMYIPLRQTGDYAVVDLVIRTAQSPATVANAVRAALRPIDPTIPANEFRTLQELVDRSVSPRRVIVLLLAGFAGFALILASLGIYAVISYSVQQRTKEIGIRMALGASSTRLQGGILAKTLGLALTGAVIGIAGAWALGSTIRGLLYGVESTDPMTFAGMLVMLACVAGIAGYLPARRASRIDPLTALRAD